MKLRLKRSQGSAGMLSKSVTFILEARAELSQEERHNVDKYKLGNEVIYSSERSRKHLDGGREALSAGGAGGLLRGALATAMASMSLNITINSLTQGQTIQGKSLDEIIAAEEAVREGCQNMKAYLEAASLFNGKEEVVEI